MNVAIVERLRSVNQVGTHAPLRLRPSAMVRADLEGPSLFFSKIIFFKAPQSFPPCPHHARLRLFASRSLDSHRDRGAGGILLCASRVAQGPSAHGQCGQGPRRPTGISSNPYSSAGNTFMVFQICSEKAFFNYSLIFVIF